VTVRARYLRYSTGLERSAMCRFIKFFWVGILQVTWNSNSLDFSSALFYNTNNVMRKKRFQVFFENSEDVFDSLGPQLLNQHLKKTMVGLSTKGFRTYSVTKTLQDELCEIKQKNS